MDSVAVERRKDEIPVGRIAHDAVEIEDAAEWRLRADPLVYLVANGRLGRIPSGIGARSRHVVAWDDGDAEDPRAASLHALRDIVHSCDDLRRRRVAPDIVRAHEQDDVG